MSTTTWEVLEIKKAGNTWPLLSGNLLQRRGQHITQLSKGRILGNLHIMCLEWWFKYVPWMYKATHIGLAVVSQICIWLDWFGPMTIWTPNDRNSHPHWNTSWRPVMRFFRYVSSFSELSSETSLREKLRFRDTKRTQRESGKVSVTIQAYLTPSPFNLLLLHYLQSLSNFHKCIATWGFPPLGC